MTDKQDVPHVKFWIDRHGGHLYFRLIGDFILMPVSLLVECQEVWLDMNRRFQILKLFRTILPWFVTYGLLLRVVNCMILFGRPPDLFEVAFENKLLLFISQIFIPVICLIDVFRSDRKSFLLRYIMIGVVSFFIGVLFCNIFIAGLNLATM
jgi:hypothetical protein